MPTYEQAVYCVSVTLAVAICVASAYPASYGLPLGREEVGQRVRRPADDYNEYTTSDKESMNDFARLVYKRLQDQILTGVYGNPEPKTMKADIYRRNYLGSSASSRMTDDDSFRPCHFKLCPLGGTGRRGRK
ncbi:PREDICTED: uncharacterized protein LOC106804916 [Priapulus caudatus]|uniref:Uncharacterized protein LOC106804916 n=1 Tax=Priapulus caudatus TaxID=37621 RepID=A0ABM1DPD5_PRICU|nr:PREDICTED: uncharacterized protein LOC106804916 [Priapulus caudatus]